MVHRVAVVDKDVCHSRKCGVECVRFCPVNRGGNECVFIGEDGKSVIREELCTGCGICVKKCPFEAITVVNLAEELKEEKVHQYGINSFRLYRLPTIKRGSIVGLVGRNGVGKTTAVNILAGSLKPNLGNYDDPPDWDDIIESFKGTELKAHFEKVASKTLRASVKPQAIYLIPRLWKDESRSLLKKYDERDVFDELVDALSLQESLDKPVRSLSGGELQRLAVAIAAARDADIYLFDEPSSYNDVYQRLAVAKVINSLANLNKAVVVVEHDLTILDYLSDHIHILYGESGAYGIVSNVQTARTGINFLLDGYLPTENVRFREKPVIFEVPSTITETVEAPILVSYTDLVKKYPGFRLEVSAGSLRQGEVLGILGANALGKTTFLKLIAGVEKQDEGELICNASVSYKPQYLSSDYDGDVKSFLEGISEAKLNQEPFESDVLKPLGIRRLFDKRVNELSGGELQKVAITSCLMRDAEVYALDEPSAFIDIEDRIALARAIQKFVKATGKAAFIVDHDVQLIDIVSDSLMIFTGKPACMGKVSPPLPKMKGMNIFLKDLGITYRRDPDSGRPRVNKPGSRLDRNQKAQGRYYYVQKEEADLAGR